MTTGPRTKFGIDMLKTLTYLDLLIQNPENEKKLLDSPWVGVFPIGKINKCLKQNREHGHISPLLLEKNNTW